LAVFGEPKHTAVVTVAVAVPNHEASHDRILNREDKRQGITTIKAASVTTANMAMLNVTIKIVVDMAAASVAMMWLRL